MVKYGSARTLIEGAAIRLAPAGDCPIDASAPTTTVAPQGGPVPRRFALRYGCVNWGEGALRGVARESLQMGAWIPGGRDGRRVFGKDTAK